MSQGLWVSALWKPAGLGEVGMTSWSPKSEVTLLNWVVDNATECLQEELSGEAAPRGGRTNSF